MRRAPALILCALCWATCPARDLPPVSYEARALGAEAALKAIGQQVGLSISVSPELGREVMVIKLTKAPAEEALNQIAEVLHGEWTKTDTQWRLDRSGATRTALLQADHIKFTAAIKGWLEKPDNARFPGQTAEMELMAPATRPDEPEQDPKEAAKQKLMMEIYQQHSKAQAKLWKDIRANLDPNFIANIGLNDRVVLSTAPTVLQRAVPPAIAAAVREYNAGAVARQQALVKAGFAEEDFDPGSMGAVSRMLLVCDRPTPYSWQIEIVGLDREQNRTLQNQLQPAVMDQNGLMAMFDPESRTKAVDPTFKLNGPESKVPTSESFKSFSMFINSVTQGAPPPMIDAKEMLRFFRNPVQFDPLSQTPTSALLTLAEDQKTNLVAVVPDEAFVLEGASMYNRELTLKSAVSALEQLGTCDFESKDGWTTLRPRFPSIDGLARLDRNALQVLINKDEESGSLSVMDKGTFLLTYPEFSEMLWQIYQFLAAPSMTEGMFEGMAGVRGKNDAYRFFASLNPPERSALLEGKAISYSALTGASRAKFDRCLGELVSLGGKNPEMRSPFIPESSPADFRQASPPFADITDLPPQVASQGFVTLSVDNDIVVRPVSDEFNFFMMQTLTPDALAMLKQMMSQPEAAAYSGMMPKLDRLRPGSRTRLDIKFAATPEFGGRHLLSGIQMTGDKRGVKESDLPPAFLAALRKAEEDYRRLMQGDGEAMPDAPPVSEGGTTPP